MLRIAPGGERVRRRLGDHIHARFWEAGAPRQIRHDAVQPVVGPHFLGAVHAQDNRVREPIRREVGRDGENESEHQTLSPAERLAEKHQQPSHGAEEQCSLYCIRHDAD